MSLLSNPLNMASREMASLASAGPRRVESTDFGDFGLFESLTNVSNVSHHDDFRNRLGRLPFGETLGHGAERRLLGLNQPLFAPTPDQWAGMSIEQRLDALMAGLLVRTDGLPQQDAAESWLQVKGQLAGLAAVQPGQWESYLEEMSLAQQEMVSVAIRLRHSLFSEAAPHHYDLLLDVAEGIEPGPIFPSEAYLYAKWLVLDAWVDWNKVAASDLRPSEVLQAVFRQHGQVLPEQWWETTYWLEADSERQSLLDEAALLNNQLRPGQTSADAMDEAPSMIVLRRKFHAALTQDLEHQALLDGLFAQPSESAPYFDGLAFRNAPGKSFDDLLAELQKAPACAALSAAQCRALLTEKFAQVGESPQFTSGSVPRSLASATLRVLRYQEQPLPEAFDTPRAALERLRELDSEWEKTRHYPIRPWLLFCQHLARSSGVVITDSKWREALWRKEVLPRLQSTEREATDSDRLELKGWVRQQLARWDKPGKPWYAQGDVVREAALTALFDTLAGIARPLVQQTAPLNMMGVVGRIQSPAPPDSAKRLAKALTDRFLQREVLQGDDGQARVAALYAYGQERVLLALAGAPRFAPEVAARKILREHGMSDEEIDEVRPYRISDDRSQKYLGKTGSRLEEFLVRAKSSLYIGNQMAAGESYIRPKEHLAAAEQRFNDELPTNLWVRAKAKDLLRQRQIPLTDSAIAWQIKTILGDYETHVEGHDPILTWETVVSMTPVIGSLYMVEEGIRHHSWREALLGMVFLSLDGFVVLDAVRGLGRGAVAEGEHLASLPVGERATLNSLTQGMPELDLGLDEIAFSPDAISLDRDPYNLVALDHEVPHAQRASAARVRNGETGLSWNDHPLAYIHDEDRVAPVEHVGGYYHELDWQTGRRIENARPIYRNPATERYYAHRVGLRGGAPGAGVALAKEETVVKTMPLLLHATDLTTRDFLPLFRKRFTISVKAGASSFDFADYFHRCYRESPTFRRLFNLFVDGKIETEPGHWNILVGYGEKPSTNFEAKLIFLPADADLQRLSYIGAEGAVQAQPMQIYQHEMMSGLTGLRDPSHLVVQGHRGPIVYLEGKVHNEMGEQFTQQLVYRRPSDIVEGSALHEYPETVGKILQRVQEENRYLDELADANVRVSADAKVLGEAVAARATVRDSLQTLKGLDRYAGRQWGLDTQFFDKFDTMFELPPELHGTDEFLRQAKLLDHLAMRFYAESDTFAALLERYGETEAKRPGFRPWQIVFDDEAASRTLPQGRVSHCINDLARTINVINDDTYYLSELGLVPIEFERKFVQLMVQVMAKQRDLPAALVFSNRGCSGQLTDMIFREAGVKLPRRLAAATVDGADAVSRAKLLRGWIDAQRAASTEDRFLLQKGAAKKACVRCFP